MFSFNCEIAINIYTFDVICIQCEWMGIEVSILRYKFPKYFYVFTIFSIYDIAMLDVAVSGARPLELMKKVSLTQILECSFY